MALALFDLDNTLIAGDSDHRWGEFMVEHGLVNGEDFRRRNDAFYAEYEAGQMDILAYLRFALEPLTRFSRGELDQWHRQFMAEKIQPIRLPRAESLLAEHRTAGDTLAIITSTNRFITAPIAALLGVEHLMATELAVDGDYYSGDIVGEPCYREGKITRVRQWLADKPWQLEESYFYSDSINDLPLLEAVGHPVVVDPDAQLRRQAGARQWPILELRDELRD